MRSSLLILFLFAFAVFAGPDTVFSQVHLDRISVTERSDERGFVVRYHLTEMVDSFSVAQPSEDRIQMKLFSADLEDAVLPELTLPPAETVFADFRMYQIPNGFGLEIVVESGHYFLASAYPDQNQRDVLLALENISQGELEAVTSVTEPFAWIAEEPEEETVEEAEPVEPEGDADEVVPAGSGYSLKFGVRIGQSHSNFLNKNFTNDPRSKFMMGVPMDIALPVILPRGIGLGVESGAYYIQKGIENPSSEFNSKFLRVDYLEIPVLAKFSYPLTDFVIPHVVIGPYIGFMISSESETESGRVNDFDDFTNEVDAGGLFGLGTDVTLGYTTLNARLGYSIGFKPVFTFPDDSGEIHSVFSLMIGITF